MIMMPWTPSLILSLRKIGENRNVHISKCVTGRVQCLFKKIRQTSFCICNCFSKIALLITDGKQTTISSRTEPSPEQVSATMQARGIEVMAMGIGQADPIAFIKYVSSVNYFRFVRDFTDLDDRVLEQADLLCPRKLQRS